MAEGGAIAAAAGTLGSGPAGVQAVGGSDGQEADVAAQLAQAAGGGDGLGRDAALIGDHHLAVGAGLAPPVGAVDGALAEGCRYGAGPAAPGSRVLRRR